MEISKAVLPASQRKKAKKEGREVVDIAVGRESSKSQNDQYHGKGCALCTVDTNSCLIKVLWEQLKHDSYCTTECISGFAGILFGIYNNYISAVEGCRHS